LIHCFKVDYIFKIVCLVVASGVQGAPLEAENIPSTMPPCKMCNLVEDQDYTPPPKLTPEQERIAILHAALNSRKKSGSYGRKRRAPVEIKESVNEVTGVEIQNHGERGQTQLDLQHGKPIQMTHGRRNRRSPVKITDSVIAVTGVEIQNHGERGQTQLDQEQEHAKPSQMKHGRRKRNPQDDQTAVETSNNEEVIVDAPSTGPVCALDLSPIQRILCKAGAKPTPVVFNEGYGRRKRSPIDFIPFNVYDENRVNTLRVEQNDFMAVERLRQEAETVQAQVTEVHLPSLVNEKQQ